ncbi:MAG: outer membrane beta-barrel protein [Janthinobacterium lividum]
MPAFRFLCSALLLGTPFASLAQSIDLPTTPHFYGGLGVYSSTRQDLGNWNLDQTRIPVQALVGYQLRPHLAVQLGVAYSGNSNDYAYSTSYSSTYPSPPSAIVDFAGSYKERFVTATLLARYGLTRKPSHRFQADVLGGAKFEYARYSNLGTQTTHDQAAPVSTAYDSPSTYTQPALSLGFGLRYRLVGQLEVAYDFTFDLPVTRSDYYYSSRLQSSAFLGLRYHFGPS